MEGINLMKIIDCSDIDNIVSDINCFLKKTDSKKREILQNQAEKILNYILEAIETKGYLSNDCLSCNIENYKITEEEYVSLFDKMIEYAGKQNAFEDEDNEFFHEIYLYRHNNHLIELFVMYGQGTYTSFSQVCRVNLTDLNKELSRKIIDFSDFLKHINER